LIATDVDAKPAAQAAREAARYNGLAALRKRVDFKKI